jgi:pimeloyl-ACP methyl ester carboxylesterase
MATFVLLHGAASDSWYWHRVVPLLRAEGHTVVAPDLPCDDDSAGFEEYADAAVSAVSAVGAAGAGATAWPLVVVAQSLAGFTAPLVAERLPVDLLVLVAAMAPRIGEVTGDWWTTTGWADARREAALADGRGTGEDEDAWDLFFHDVPPDVTAEAAARGERDQSGTPFAKALPLDAWPDVPTRFLLCRHDRFFPAEFQHRVVPERLGIVPDEMDGGHLPALARPRELADRLLAYASGA